MLVLIVSATFSTNQLNSTEAIEHEKNVLNLDALAYAVSVHESVSCRRAIHNNCHGIMVWDKNGVRSLKQYATIEESFEDFKVLWENKYKNFPDLYLARRYTGRDRAEAWLSTVTKHYNLYINVRK